MKKPVLLIIILALWIIAAMFIYKNSEMKKEVVVLDVPAIETPTSNNPVVNMPATSDEKNISYNIDGKDVLLVDGVSTITSETGSSTTTITSYFGNDISKDLNNDGKEDKVFLITQENGGSGVFFYVVAAINTQDGYVWSNAILLGDRIAPQTTESGPNDSIIVNYMVRANDESMSTQPSIGKSLYLRLNTTTMEFEKMENPIN